jgi:hypothetical protein
MDWLEQSACRGKNVDMWYAPLDASNPNDYYAVGKTACRNCSVWKDCMKLGAEETWGMWGGLTPQERRGTVKLQHGTLESYRKGCRCTPCIDESIAAMDYIMPIVLPSRGETFDVKSLLYALINP